MATARSVKPWKLSEDETFSSYTSWQQNIVYCLNQDINCQPFLLNATWRIVSPDHPHRGLTDDAGDNGLKKEQKVMNLNSMLGYISQFVPHYLSTDIKNSSTSINSVWGTIRQYYGFQQSEVQFLKFTNISWEGMHAERPERLYRRVLAHLQDNLLQAGSKLRHNDAEVTRDELISPTVERLAVLRWMELLHPKLPSLVARTFAYDLQRMTLKDIQPQIADGLENFLEELNKEDTPIQVSKMYTTHRPQTRGRSTRPNFPQQQRRAAPSDSRKQCRVCRAEKRPFVGHDLASCHFISEADRRSLIRSVDTSYEPHPYDNQDEYFPDEDDDPNLQ